MVFYYVPGTILGSLPGQQMACTVNRVMALLQIKRWRLRKDTKKLSGKMQDNVSNPGPSASVLDLINVLVHMVPAACGCLAGG